MAKTTSKSKTSTKAAKKQATQTNAVVSKATKKKTASKTVVKQNNPIGTATVTCSSLNVRKGPGTNYARIGGLSQGKQVQVFEDKDGWLRISYSGQEGWICKQYTDFKRSETVTQPETPKPETPQPETPKPETNKQVVTTDALNLRDIPGNGGNAASGSTILATMPAGTTLTVEAEQNGWYKVTYNGKTGWCCATYTSEVSQGQQPQEPKPEEPKPQEPQPSNKDVVTTDALRLRDAPVNGNILTTMPAGTRLTVIAEQNGWYQVTYNGMTGWCSAEYTTEYKAPDISGNAQQDAVNYASQFINRTTKDLVGTIPHLQDLSGISGTNNGYDLNCANFACAILQNFNLISGHTNTVSGLASKCQSFGYQTVSKSTCRPGDVWCSSGHAELVYSNQGGVVKLIGSNNGGDNVQEVTYDSWSPNNVSATYYGLR